MREFVEKLFSSDFMPHGYCYLWRPDIVWLHAISDSTIALAYYVIPVLLLYFVRRRRDLPFHWIFVMFGVFIFGCGTTHLMEVWTLWHGTYRLSGVIKAITAGASVVTAAALFPMIPKALALPSPEALRVEIADRKRAEQALQQAKTELELRVQERTVDLTRANETLAAEIEQRKRVEAELRQSEERLRVAQKASGAGAWDWNIAENSATWSEAHSRIFGFEPDHPNHTFASFLQLVHPDDRRTLESAVWGALKPDGELNAEYRIRRSDGQVRWVLSKGQTFCDPAGEPIRMIGLTQDVTERKQLEQALLSTQAELAHASRILVMGELTGSIAHEVNQPLAAIVINGDACLRWLAAQSPNFSRARESLNEMIREANRASEIIKRIRRLAKKAAPQKETLAVNDVIPEVVALVRRELVKADVLLRTEIIAELPLILADRVQLQQVVLNLVMNGIEAMTGVIGRSKELCITSKRSEENGILISVSDNGKGIGSDPPEHLFQSFFTTKQRGLGLGLSISRTIVEAHGGRLWATANAVYGATFSFTLPLTAGAAA